MRTGRRKCTWFCSEENKMCFSKPGTYSAVLLLLVLTSPAVSRSHSSELFGWDDATAEFHQDAIRLKRQSSNTCLTPENNPGQCVPKKDCPQYVALSKLVDNLASVADYLESAVCRLPSSRNMRFEFGHCCNLDVKDSPVTAVKNPFPATCGRTDRIRNKIVGGVHAEKHAWPWLALVGYQRRPNLPAAWICGGTLITEKHVLTAAHCMAQDVSLSPIVRLGAHDLEDPNETSVIKDIRIADVIMHQTYSANHMKYLGRATHYGYDIALLVLQTTVVFQAGVISPICLPVVTPRSGDSLDLKKNDVWAAGWGKTEFGVQSSSHLLREVRIGIVPNKKCQRSYSSVRIDITDPMLCAGSPGGGKDTCQGDSGGPLMVSETVQERQQFYQVGIVSFGNDCGLADFPGVYTRVSSFMDWIRKKVQETS